jgi:dienelactone hydrolase
MSLLRRSLVLFFFACSSTPPAATQGPTVRFVTSAAVPNFMDVPFPSDAYLVNGKIGNIPGLDAIIPQNSDMLQHALSVEDGFARTAFTEFYVDDPSAPPNDDGSVAAAQIDKTSLPQSEDACAAPTSSVFLVDLAAGKLLPCRARFHVSPTGRSRPTLAIAPARGLVLDGHHQYAAVVTSRVTDTSGKHIAASDDFAKIASGDRSASVGPLYGGAFDEVTAAVGSLGADSIVGLAVFTTNQMEDELFALRDQLETAAAPTLAWDSTSMAPMGAAKFASESPLPAGFTASLDDWLGVPTAPKLPDGTDDPDELLPVRAHDAIDAIGTAVFDATNYLSVRPNGYVDPEHANFARDANGNIVPAPEQPTSKIWVTLFVPKTAMPANGYPVVIVQHGLSNSRIYSFDLANTFCKNGWMVAAIDSVTFGARAPEPQYQHDDHSVWASAPGAKYDGPDGLADPVNGAVNGSSDLFGSLLNLGALRDQLRQAELDTTQLVKVLRSKPDLSALQTGSTAPAIDPAHVAYVGTSLGGIEGAVASALEPNLDAWTLDVVGGGVVNELAARSPVISSSLNAGALNFGDAGDQLTESHLLVTLLQTITEPGDPLLYAKYLVTAPHALAGNPTKPRNVLQTEVLFDELVTNEADEAFARAAGFSLAGPNVGSNAEIGDLAHPDQNPWAIPFSTVTADSTGIHDTPVQGTTAVVVQVGPATHGDDLVKSKGTRSFKAPWALYDTLMPFPKLATPYDVRTSYREEQGCIAGFFSSAFAGQTPVVAGFKPPVRDLDDDGTPDATDPDPNDPNVH